MRRWSASFLAVALITGACGGEPSALSVDPNDDGTEATALTTDPKRDTPVDGSESTTTSSPAPVGSSTTATANGPETTLEVSGGSVDLATEETFLADVDGRAMRIALRDGKGVDIIADFSEEGGTFLGSIEDAGAENPGAYISATFEDYWYSCDSQPGLVWWYPAGGEREPVDRGIRPKVSPDGTKLAFLASTECEESDEPGEFIAHLDTVVLVDRINGQKRRVRWSAAVMGTDDSDIGSLAWDADSSAIFLSRDKDIRRLELDGPSLSSAEIVWKYATEKDVHARLVGHRADNGRLLFHEVSLSAGNLVGRTVEIDTLTAVRKATPWTADYLDTALDRQGTRVLRLIGDGIIEMQDGDDVRTIEVDGDVTLLDW